MLKYDDNSAYKWPNSSLYIQEKGEKQIFMLHLQAICQLLYGKNWKYLDILMELVPFYVTFEMDTRTTSA